MATVLAGCQGQKTATSTTQTTAAGVAKLTKGRCAPHSCALVNYSLSKQGLTVYAGLSCKGVLGPWYLNAARAGNGLDPSFHLTWSFDPKTSSASPDGEVFVHSSGKSQLTVRLHRGTLVISGVGPAGQKVHLSEQLTVHLVGSSTSAALTVTEGHLAGAHTDLGLTAVFGDTSAPLKIPITLARAALGC